MNASSLLPGLPRERIEGFVRAFQRDPKQWAVVFGAGLSVGAGLPSWRDLARDVALAVGHPDASLFGDREDGRDSYPSSRYPKLLSECRDRDPSKFWPLVKRKVCRNKADATSAQELLAQLPFELFVSLNYDCLLESCWVRSGALTSDRVVAYPNIRTTRLSERRLLYLHGRCPGRKIALSDANLVLTREGYASAYAYETSEAERAVRNVLMDYNLLFVGTSLKDPDFRQLLRKEEQRNLLSGPGHRPSKRWFMLRETAVETYSPALDLDDDDLDGRLKYLFYWNPEGGQHRELENFLSYLLKAVP